MASVDEIEPPLLPECFEEPKEKPIKVVKRKKYQADGDVVNALKKSLDTCTDTPWTDSVVILYDKTTGVTYMRSTFDTQMEMLIAVDLAKMRFVASTAEGEDDDKD